MNNNNLRIVGLLVMIILASGCASVDVNHELHKDGSSDIGIEVDSDSQIASNAIKGTLESNLAVENAVLEDGDDSFSYRFENVYPQVQEDRFSDTLSSSSDDGSSNSTFDYEKEPGLVYTHFTISMNSEGFDTSQGSSGDGKLGSGLGESLSSSMEFNYDIKPFGTIVDTNGQELSDGGVRFDLTKDKEYFVEFKAVSADLLLTNLGSSKPEQPEWEFSDWSTCSKNGTQTRDVEIKNDAENYMFKPRTERSCEYEVQKELDEMLLDESEVEEFSKTTEQEIDYRDISNAYRAIFENGDTNVTHIVVKPDNTDEFLASESRSYEEGNYESAISYIDGADNSTAYTGVLGTKTTTEGNGFYNYESETEIVREVLIASKFDVVHLLQANGESNFGSSVAGVDVDSLGETAIQKTE